MNNKSTKSIKSYLLAVGACILLVILDQLTKWLAVTHLKDQAAFVIWKGVFKLEYLENRGAAFGIMQNKQFLFAIGAVVIVALIGYAYGKMPHTSRYYLLRICAVLISAGAFGNLIDRVRLNYVVDFFYFELIDFPIFNVADCYVVVACILFALSILFYYKEEELKCFSIGKGSK
ncbi:MAG: signal peptidase II [Faecalicatena sp.]|uniref:signal peptidase II n=1 Tax=Faecalicatena sp. TaxID=2005360 RepID=UPI00258E1DB9|nr:signal peptidase II [Faecalicatena sp.]MCI6467193.1 signal peptidase II [Faecalicatena sp.]MDY5620198.1 signal peptidase II [Lachnospiraceae bacterium]